jgi:tubulin--tyrosine ligase-like protein 12
MDEATFQEYETHFTVMNYGKKMTNIRCKEFMELFNQEYAPRDITFQQLIPKVHQAIADVFIAFQTKHAKEI